MGKINLSTASAPNHRRTFQFVTSVMSQGIVFPFTQHPDQEARVTVPKSAHTHRRGTHCTDISASGQNTTKKCSQVKILHYSGLFCATWSPGHVSPWIPNVGYQQGLVWWMLLNVTLLLQSQQSSGTEDTYWQAFVFPVPHRQVVVYRTNSKNQRKAVGEWGRGKYQGEIKVLQTVCGVIKSHRGSAVRLLSC